MYQHHAELYLNGYLAEFDFATYSAPLTVLMAPARSLLTLQAPKGKRDRKCRHRKPEVV